MTLLTRLLAILTCTAIFAVGPSPVSVTGLGPAVNEAEARPGGRGGGFRGARAHRGGGARARHMNRARPSGGRTRPATRPATRPPGGANRPSTRPSRPDGGHAGRPPGNRPPGARPPGNRPPGARPPGGRPPGARPPGNRPPGARPPGNRPPGARPPHARPPGHRPRPPGWRPPHWRPPAWRPPAYRPPYYRPPHPRWGSYYYYPRWGWYFTAGLASATLVYVATLPRNDCQQVVSDGETMYVCDGVLYRSTVHEGQRVYEIVSEPEEVVDPAAGAATDSYSPPGQVLQLTSPYIRGNDVLAVQRELAARGYDLGTPDGVFGPATDRAVRAFQASVGLPASGVVTQETRSALGL